jgi:N-acetylglucosamine-6-phosphate deacetylase
MSGPHYHAVVADNVFDGAAVLRDSAVIIEGSQVVAVRSRRGLSTTMPAHSLPENAWLAPGFIDVQVNGGADVLFNDAPTVEGIRAIAAAHRRCGTTAFLPTLLSDTADKMRVALLAVQKLTAENPSVLGIHFEGPFLSPEKPGVHDPAMFRIPHERDLDLLTSWSAV